MALLFGIISTVLLVFLLLLFARFVVDWVMVLAHSWRPSGIVAADYPDGDKDSSFNSYAYSTSQLMIYVLQKCGDNLTRENVMKVATSLKNVPLDLNLPGIVANTTPDDYRVNKQLQMMRFNGERWEMFGPILEDTGPAG